MHISNTINEILKDSKEWNETADKIVIPLVKKYEGQLCRKEEKKEEEKNDDILEDIEPPSRKSRGSAFLLQQLLNVIKKEVPNKRSSMPFSRNEKNPLKPKNDKSSIRDKLLKKGGIRNQKIFLDEEDEKNKDNNINENDGKNEENDSEENKNYNDTNFWQAKNGLPEKVRKEVDKKTNIIFNYNPNTYKCDNKDSIDEEDEILRDAMELEQKEKMEKKN